MSNALNQSIFRFFPHRNRTKTNEKLVKLNLSIHCNENYDSCLWISLFFFFVFNFLFYMTRHGCFGMKRTNVSRFLFVTIKIVTAIHIYSCSQFYMNMYICETVRHTRCKRRQRFGSYFSICLHNHISNIACANPLKLHVKIGQKYKWTIKIT